MKAIYTFVDNNGAKVYVVISKIRKVALSLGSIILEFDNGDTETYDVENGNEILKEILNSLEEFYK